MRCLADDIAAKLEESLHLDENECLLWHGTTKQSLDYIINSGFDERVASDGGLYGH